MLLFAIIAIIGCLALVGWLVFNMATYALPVMVAVFAARALHAEGLQWLLAVPAGCIAGIATFAVGQLSLAFLRPTWAKLLVIAVFVAPSAFTGYYAAYGLSNMLTHEPITRSIIGGVGAVVIAITAFVRLRTPPAALPENP